MDEHLKIHHPFTLIENWRAIWEVVVYLPVSQPPQFIFFSTCSAMPATIAVLACWTPPPLFEYLCLGPLKSQIQGPLEFVMLPVSHKCNSICKNYKFQSATCPGSWWAYKQGREQSVSHVAGKSWRHKRSGSGGSLRSLFWVGSLNKGNTQTGTAILPRRSRFHLTSPRSYEQVS